MESENKLFVSHFSEIFCAFVVHAFAIHTQQKQRQFKKKKFFSLDRVIKKVNKLKPTQMQRASIKLNYYHDKTFPHNHKSSPSKIVRQ